MDYNMPTVKKNYTLLYIIIEQFSETRIVMQTVLT